MRKRVIADTYLAGATESLAAQWVCVEDKEPPIGVLILCRDAEESALCVYDGEDILEVPAGTKCRLPYWMPIPDLPKRRRTMNREIRFRAKTLNYDPMTMPVWAEGWYYQELHDGNMHHLITDGAHTFEVDPDTLGRFTGLQDKEGGDIYEGDIIETSTHSCEVYWCDNSAAFVAIDVEHEKRPLLSELAAKAEIVGTIYDGN